MSEINQHFPYGKKHNPIGTSRGEKPSANPKGASNAPTPEAIQLQQTSTVSEQALWTHLNQAGALKGNQLRTQARFGKFHALRNRVRGLIDQELSGSSFYNDRFAETLSDQVLNRLMDKDAV